MADYVARVEYRCQTRGGDGVVAHVINRPGTDEGRASEPRTTRKTEIPLRTVVGGARCREKAVRRVGAESEGWHRPRLHMASARPASAACR